MSLVFDHGFNSPAQARREAQDEPVVSECDCLSAASFTSRRLIRASQGTRRARMSGVFDIFLVCFFRQVKKSHSSMKGETYCSNGATNYKKFIKHKRKNTKHDMY